jgi:hypothetical protein
MTSALPVHVALVDETATIAADELAHVAGALNEQVLRDFSPVWHVRASVGAYPQAPANTWAIRIRRSLDEPGALGYHTDEHNQPVSYVMLTDDWPATCSHELLEMLADPWGSRLHGGRLPAGLETRHKDFGLKTERSHVSYLLEVCDPPEATSYEVGDVPVSDFIAPPWYSATGASRVNFSFAGGCRTPRHVAAGGYVSFAAPSGEWFQCFADRGGKLTVQDLGRFDRARFSSLREFTDFSARAHRTP